MCSAGYANVSPLTDMRNPKKLSGSNVSPLTGMRSRNKLPGTNVC